jgi:hypothetical protein
VTRPSERYALAMTFNPLEDSADAIEEQKRNGTFKEKFVASTATGQQSAESEFHARPGAEDTGDDPTASAHAHNGNTPAAATPVAADPGNPFTHALVTIYVISFLLGAVLVGIGAANAASYYPAAFSGQSDNGVALIIWGGAFFNLGIVAAMVHLGAAAVLYRLHRLTTPPVPTAP